MKYVSELKEILSERLEWHKPRLDCFAQIFDLLPINDVLTQSMFLLFFSNAPYTKISTCHDNVRQVELAICLIEVLLVSHLHK